MLLIIEGMDRCGKSTLVQNLRKKYFKNNKENYEIIRKRN